MMTDMDIFGSILTIFMLSGLIYVIYGIKKSGLTFEEPITHGKNKFDVAFREFVRATLRGLIITLWGNKK